MDKWIGWDRWINGCLNGYMDKVDGWLFGYVDYGADL